MITNSRWWASYSFRQCAVHLEEEREALTTNLHAFLQNRPVDFVPLGVFDTEKEARLFLDVVQRVRNHREGGCDSAESVNGKLANEEVFRAFHDYINRPAGSEPQEEHCGNN